jgi:hypothetical protein
MVFLIVFIGTCFSNHDIFYSKNNISHKKYFLKKLYEKGIES